MYLVRYLMFVKFNKQIKSDFLVLIQPNVKVILEEGAKITFGKNVLIKNDTIIYAKKNSSILFGDNTSTGHHTEISANNRIRIGNDVIMGAYTYITDADHRYDDPHLPIRLQPMNIGEVTVGDNVWLGRGVMVLKDSHVGSNCVVAAGSIVTKKFDDNIVIGGIPAKVIKPIERLSIPEELKE